MNENTHNFWDQPVILNQGFFTKEKNRWPLTGFEHSCLTSNYSVINATHWLNKPQNGVLEIHLWAVATIHVGKTTHREVFKSKYLTLYRLINYFFSKIILDRLVWVFFSLGKKLSILFATPKHVSIFTESANLCQYVFFNSFSVLVFLLHIANFVNFPLHHPAFDNLRTKECSDFLLPFPGFRMFYMLILL